VYGGLLRRLGRWLHLQVLLLFERDLLAPAAAVAVPTGYSFRAISAAELLEAARDPALQLSAEGIDAAQRRGDLFFGIFAGNRLVAYRWYALSGATPLEEGLVIRYARAGRAYGYRAFTHPEHRGKRLHVYSTRLSDAELRARGYIQTVGYIAAENFASLRSNSRLSGSQRIGVIVALRVGSRRFTVRSRGVARRGITVTAKR
jgi:hypothetical protein